jgi:DNA repair protein RecN (Recombination protein N)
MLLLLRIKNFALIDQLDLEFGSSLNVLTGETGAGKSIVLDAIDVALGGKVNSRLIRTGSKLSMVEATFQGDESLIEWLREQDIELLEDRTVVCSRELAVTGETLRSRSRINGVLINRQLMAQFRDRSIEMTAQGQTVQLLMPGMQRELLDLYGGNPLLKQRKIVASAYETCQLAEKSWEERRHSEQQRLQRIDLLEYQLQELETANLRDEEELEQLERESERLSHVVDLQQLSYQAYQLLYQNDQGESAVTDLLGQAESLLNNMVAYDPAIEFILEMVRTALTQVVEAGHRINAYGDGLEADPDRLTEVEERIRLLKRLCRKYGPSLTEAIAYYQNLKAELATLTDREQSLETLEKEYRSAQAILIQACQELTLLRQKAAIQLEKQLVKELKPLAMEKVIFVCRLIAGATSATGADEIVFYFSPNPGEEIQPLASTASGGEMSRFLLALKACFSNAQKRSETLIFDEIDAGVSGKVAQAIANKLHQLSQKHQVLCVTHQPIVAAMAATHFRVDKQLIEESSSRAENNKKQPHSSETRTVIRVTRLENHQTRREEIAQLTGGHSAEDAIAFAESLLTKANTYRQEV